MISQLQLADGADSQSSGLLAWLSFTSSIVLALITLWYVVITARTLKQAQHVEAGRQQRSREEQAASIAAWVADSTVSDHTVDFTVKLRNPSAQAIYDVQVDVLDLSGGALATGLNGGRVVGPGQVIDLPRTCNLPANAGGELRTQLTFIDARGIKWIRSAEGSLSEVE